MSENVALALLVVLDLAALTGAGLLARKLARAGWFKGMLLGFLVELPRLGIAFLITEVAGELQSAAVGFLINLRAGKVPFVIMVAAVSGGLSSAPAPGARKPRGRPRPLRITFSQETNEATRASTIKQLRQKGAGIDVLGPATLRLYFPRREESRPAVQAYLDSERERGNLQYEDFHNAKPIEET